MIATVILSVALAALIVAIVVSMVKKHKRGESSCGCGCSGCAMSGVCHKEKDSK